MTAPEHDAPEELKALAKDGALCDQCGGVHVTGADAAILVDILSVKLGARLPWCSCLGCVPCQTYQRAIEPYVTRIMENQTNAAQSQPQVE